MYTITPNGTGADLSYTEGSGSDLLNNVWLSLNIPRGSWWFDQAFGLRKRPNMKNTPALVQLLQQDCRDALQWLLDNRRATAIEVDAQEVPGDRFRVRLACRITGANGKTVSYDKFVKVV